MQRMRMLSFGPARMLGTGNKQVEKVMHQEQSLQQKDQYLQFSKAPIMKNFGDLPKGEIPEPLKYERPMETTVL